MRSWRFTLFVLCIVFFNHTYASNQNSTKGKDFWLAFLPNYGTGATLQIVISSIDGAEGTVEIPKAGWTRKFKIEKGKSETIELPDEASITRNETIEGTGIHVTSSSDVSVTAVNQKYATTDASIVLPTQVLQNSYYAVTFGTSYNSQFIVVATSDDTKVKIIPSANTLKGVEAGTPINIVLNAGETYFLKSDYYKDFSGSRIESEGCKPIAVFAGNECANVGCGGCDHLYEEVLPAGSLGKSFAIPNLNAANYTLKVLATRNNTKVNFHINNEPETIISLDSGKFYSIENIASGTSSLTSNNGIYVVQFMEGRCDSTVGDPSMMFVEPLEFSTNSFMVSTLPMVEHYSHFASVIIPDKFLSQLKLDDKNYTAFTQFHSSTTGLAYVTINLSEGNHTIQADSGFVAYAFGTAFRESYAYPLGGSMQIKNSSMPVLSSIPDVQVCMGTPVPTLRLNHIGAGEICWYADPMKKDTLMRNSLVYNPLITQPGTYQYYYNIHAGSCESEVKKATVKIIGVDTIKFNPINQLKVDVAELDLNIASPIGGTYIGNAIKGNTFYPGQAGIGQHKIFYTYKNAGGCTISDSINLKVIDCCENLYKTNIEFNIYPNPTQGNLNICYNTTLADLIRMHNSYLNIYNAFGVRVMSIYKGSQVKISERLDLSTLAKGIYFIEIAVEGQSHSKKIVLQ